MKMSRLGISVGLGLFLALLLNIFTPRTTLAFSCGNNKSHNAFFGQKHPRDELLYSERAKSPSTLLRVVSVDVKYSGKNDRPSTIIYIEILDQYTDGKGGCGTITSGGVGSANVVIHLKSQRGSGLDFLVNIYGLKLNAPGK